MRNRNLIISPTYVWPSALAVTSHFGKALFFVLMVTVSSGCSLDASLEQLNSIKEVFNHKSSEVINTSSQKVITPGGKTVSASLGNSYKNLVGETPRGYKVYSTVQGQIISVQGEVQ